MAVPKKRRSLHKCRKRRNTIFFDKLVGNWLKRRECILLFDMCASNQTKTHEQMNVINCFSGANIKEQFYQSNKNHHDLNFQGFGLTSNKKKKTHLLYGIKNIIT
ncbi:hypothetical protein [Plasmodium yoelii yoelii]|uniref:Uncharacterized protein n=1 Tax=Plasmodium yoelii yoelii TaxID=73239 RepID=Q7RKB7_PLAYO|nr:hypothetical protein [Plasmodium yoelii yoelii]